MSHRAKRIVSAVCLCTGLAAACDVQEPARAEDDAVELERGSSVRTWDGAQRLEPVDASPRGIQEESGSVIVVPDSGDEPFVRPPSQVVFRVTTLPQDGRYQPKNIGAIWVEDSDGSWVKTLAVWAGVRLRYLVEYNAANTTRDKTDAITSATLREHTTHEVTWDLTDANGEVVPEGTYVVRVEATDRDAPGQSTAVEFTKSPEPVVVTAEDTAAFADVELRYE